MHLKNSNYHIVPYDKAKHSVDIAETLASSFSHDHWPFWQHTSFRFTQDVSNLLTKLCGLNYVVEEKNTGKAYGQILCMAPASFRLTLNALPTMLKMFVVGVLGLYFFRKTAWKHAYSLRHYYDFLKQHPKNKPHYEIFLFAVHKDLQGMGLGRQLMDKAIIEMHKRKAEKVVLLTDSTMSWRFYEKYNFKRITDMSIGAAYKVAMNSDQEYAYVYELDVNEKVESINKYSLKD